MNLCFSPLYGVPGTFYGIGISCRFAEIWTVKVGLQDSKKLLKKRIYKILHLCSLFLSIFTHSMAIFRFCFVLNRAGSGLRCNISKTCFLTIFCHPEGLLEPENRVPTSKTGGGYRKNKSEFPIQIRSTRNRRHRGQF